MHVGYLNSVTNICNVLIAYFVLILCLNQYQFFLVTKKKPYFYFAMNFWKHGAFEVGWHSWQAFYLTPVSKGVVHAFPKFICEEMNMTEEMWNLNLVYPLHLFCANLCYGVCVGGEWCAAWNEKSKQFESDRLITFYLCSNLLEEGMNLFLPFLPAID